MLGLCIETKKKNPKTNKQVNNSQERILQQLKQGCFLLLLFSCFSFLYNKKSTGSQYQPRARTPHYPPGSWLLLSHRSVIFSVLAFVLMLSVSAGLVGFISVAWVRRKARGKSMQQYFFYLGKNILKSLHDSVSSLADLYLMQQN